MSVLPPLDPPPNANLVLFSTQQWTWLTSAILALRAGQEAILDVEGAIINAQETIVADITALTSQVQRLEAQQAAAADAIDLEIQQLKDALAQLGSQPTQAQLDALTSRIKASVDKIAASTDALKADDPATP